MTKGMVKITNILLQCCVINQRKLFAVAMQSSQAYSYTFGDPKHQPAPVI